MPCVRLRAIDGMLSETVRYCGPHEWEVLSECIIDLDLRKLKIHSDTYMVYSSDLASH